MRRRAVVVTAVLVWGSALAGCSGHGSNAAHTSSPPPKTPEQTAHDVARTMLDAVALPRDAQLYHGPLPAILTSATNVPAVANIVDDYRSWSVPVAPKSLRNFSFASRLRGFAGPSGSGSMSTPAGFIWTQSADYPRLPLNVALAQLNVGITDDGHGGSIIRADAVVSWTPPKTSAELVPADDHVAVITVLAAATPPIVVHRVVVTDAKRYAEIVAAFDRMRLAVIVRVGECGLLNVIVPGLGAYGKGTMITEVAFSHDRRTTPNLVAWTPTCRGVGVRANGKLQPTLSGDDDFRRIARDAVVAAS